MFTTEDDIEMMRNPQQWPYKAFLPLKNYESRAPNGRPMLGILLVDFDEKLREGHQVDWEDIQERLKSRPRVYLISLHEWAQDPESIADAETVEYDSFKELVDDGWMVD